MSDRKKDHIDLAEVSFVSAAARDQRFNYEPLLSTHPKTVKEENELSYFLGSPFHAPIWVSSMTGGTAMAKKINNNLARMCNEFSLGMGLGSCRKLLDNDEYLADFDVRKIIGERPLFANLGIAQIIDLIENNQLGKINELVKKLEADGLIIHINPVQEWMQPEGDRIHAMSPLSAVKEILEKMDVKIIVKEVGQGIGPESLKALLELPLTALEFGAFGGTNFAKMEALRDPQTQEIDPIHLVGHTASEMVSFINDIRKDSEVSCEEYIISGGVGNYLDGFYYNELLNGRSVYGQAAPFLKYAKASYDALAQFVEKEIQGYKFAKRFLRVK